MGQVPDDVLEIAADRFRNSAALRFRRWDREDCVEVDFPDGDPMTWNYLTRENAGKVVEFLQRFLATPKQDVKRAVLAD